MICDAHIHTGPFRDKYFSPPDVYNFLKSAGVERFAASSTITTQDGFCRLALVEMEGLAEMAGNAFIPVLWITPNMLDNGDLEEFLKSEVSWKCIKVHGYFSDWHSNPSQLQRVIGLAREMGLPLLFHTGGRPESDAGAYSDVIKRNADVRFILAHSRPVEQTLPILRDCPNAYADTAFTPVEHVKQMIDAGFEERVLFGTDYPLPQVFYPERNMTDYYTELVSSMQQVMSASAWEKVSHLNFEKLFG